MNSEQDSLFADLEMGDEQVEQIMTIASEYEDLHRETVERKLVHAKEATAESLMSIPDASMLITGDLYDKLAQKVEKYEALWESTLSMFDKVYVPEEVLQRIDAILETIPAIIKSIYNRMVKADKKLQDMISSLKQKKDGYLIATKILGLVKAHVAEVMDDVWPYDEGEAQEKFDGDVVVFNDPQSFTEPIY